MKLRNSLLAVVTATALVSGGVAAPAHAQASPLAALSSVSSDTETTAPTTTPAKGADEKGGSSAQDANDIGKSVSTWIGVIAAAIGLLSTILTFATKNLGVTLPKLG
ncbi:hypothetical protein [Corynebacterium sanguinis]|uniref:hypothetical protein n=1 Tax=Corynebacterium sanguinis TaxID=2594913 RepID=UPI00223AC1B6|nr:hypothetical protein [Corynebacterium sanguinis]MCT1426369.1 hypothetical protein [Corynebacterium sanguinis]MCT1628312.1 hypothetical protein [Corynebacterium sanguinis]MDN8576272.1 hypothetical protein [Corynebacterium sanguinis]